MSSQKRTTQTQTSTAITWNEINNQQMLAINTKFGFTRQPAWITLRKDLGE